MFLLVFKYIMKGFIMVEYTKQRLKSMKTKEKIYKTALSLFKEHEYEDVKVSDICDKAKVSVGSFYNHYKTKSDIINQAFDEMDDRSRLLYEDKPEESVLNRIQDLLMCAAIVIEAYGYKVVTQIIINQLKYGEEYLFKKQWFLEEILIKILKGKYGDEDIIENYKAQEISDIILRTFRGMVIEWCAKRERLSLTSLVEEHIQTQYIIFKK